MTTTYTVAQALATNATGLLVVDSAANIASNLSNGSLVSRVSLFSMSANGIVTASQAAALAGVGSQFSTAGHALTERDSVAQLTSANNAAGLTISGIVVGLQDTAANILAAIGNPIIRNATSVVLTANATLTLAQLLTLESFASFSTTGLTLTLSDSATNLLAFTASEAKPALTVFQIGVNSTVSVAQALTLEAMAHFGIASSATLTVSDSIANLSASVTALYAVFVLPGAVVNATDTLTDLLALSTHFPWFAYPNVSVTLSNSGLVTASQAATLAALPNFAVGAGQHLTISDTVNHLAALSAGQIAIAAAFTLSGNDTATAAQLAILSALTNFTAGHTLTVDDTLANLAALSAPQHALASAETVDDTVTNLLAAQPSALSGASVIVAELDGATVNAAQATALAALAANAALTLHGNGTHTSLTISDNAADLTAAAAAIATLEADGSVSVVTNGSTNGSILDASDAAALVHSGANPASGLYAVTDTGSALSAVAATIFGHGFVAITVTSGSFAGTMAQLLDPTLHFVAGSTAQLGANATPSVAQALELAGLPNFNLAANVTLAVLDSTANILAAASALPAIATSILANDTEIVSAAAAATLAALSGFSLNGNYLTLNDTAANLETTTPGAIALATAVNLTSDARISAAAALQFVGMGLKFSPNGFFVTVADTVGNLETLATFPSALSVVNGWNGESVLSANGTATVADATALSHLAGFNVGAWQLTIGDSAANLLGASGSVMALANVVQISQASSVTAADAATLEALHNFSANGMLTISDTPADLAAMAASLATPASSVSLTAETGGNASGYAIDAAQFAAMLGLSHFSMNGFAGTLLVTDTAALLAALVPSLSGLSLSALSHVAMMLGASATVTVAAAEALNALPGFNVGTATLTISDTAAALVTLDFGTAALAAVIEISTPTTVNASTAASLAALHNFVTDIEPITIADTPANLAAMSLNTAAIAAADVIVPITGGTAADYTLNASQFLHLVANLVAFPAYGGPLIVQDTALNLASLAGAFIGAGLASPIAESRSVLSTYLAESATVDIGIMGYLIGMPGFNLHGHTLTLQDTPTNLIGAFSTVVPFASEVELAANGTAWVVTAAQAAQLATIGPLNAGPAGMIVADTVANLLTGPYAAGIAAATATTLDQDSIVNVSQAEALHALPNFSRGAYNLTISDTAADIASLDAATAALANSIVANGGPSSLSVAAFNSLVDVPGFSGTPDSLTVSDTAAQLLILVGSSNLTYIASTMLLASAAVSASDAQRLSTLPHLLLGNNLTIADTAADLLNITGAGTTPDDWAITLQAMSVTLTANAAAVTAAQVALLAQLGPRFSNGGFTLAVQDSPTALLGLAGGFGSIASQVTSVALGSGNWTISLTQAQQLENLPGFTTGSAGVTITDSVANLSANSNAGLISSIITIDPEVTFTLAGNDTATVAQAEALHALGNHFGRGGNTLTIIDGAGHLATLDAGSAALASAIDLQGSTLTSVANFQAIRALPHYSNNGNLLVVFDTATHLLALVGTDVSLASEIMLSANAPNLSATQAEQLATLTDFTTGTANFTILDSAADLLQVTGIGSQPDDWTGELAASSVTLTGDASVTAAQACELALLGSRFSAGGNTLTVSDSAADLLSRANAGGVALAGALTLSGDETALSAASATQLAALGDFTKGGFHITVSDTAVNLRFAGYAAGLALADHVQLSQSSSMTVTAAESLIGMANFQVNAAAPLTIIGTMPHLLLLASASLPFNNDILAATSIALSANCSATAAQIEALVALPQYGSFSLNGHTLTVQDSGQNLATLTLADIAAASGVAMTGDATLSATQAGVLASEHVSLGSNSLTVADTPTALLSLTPAVAALATGLTLSGASSATTIQATGLETLAAAHLFSTGGFALTVTGSAAALLALSVPTQQLATTLVLAESGDTVGVADLLQLTELGSKFSLNSQSLIVSDTAAQLATLNNLETALVSAAVLDQSATVDTTTASELAALPNFSLGASVTLTVQGTYAELETLPGAITSIATLELTGSDQMLTAAEASSLHGLSHFLPGAGIIVQDTIANLNTSANAGWQFVATGGYVVADSISNLLANAGTTLLSGATTVTLLGDAQVDASAFATLAGMANFSRGGAALTVADGPAAIADNATEIALLASNALVDAAAPVSAGQAEALASLNAAHMLSFTGGVSLAVQDSLGNLTSGSNAAGVALANSITVLGTGPQLVAATAHGWGNVQPYYELNASGTISGPQAATLYGLGSHFLPQGYTLTALDSAANVLSNAAAIQALGIGAQVSDSVADVDAAAFALGALGGTLQSISLTDSAAVGAAAAAGLAPLASILTGPTIAVSDTASAVDSNLAALETLGTHLGSVTVSGSAEAIAAIATDLSALGSKLLVVLSDQVPVTVSADVAAGLLPVGTQLGSSTINVTDTGADIATDLAALAGLGSVLGTVTLSDGNTTDAATAAALAQIDGHLGTGVKISVADSVATIAGAAVGLGALQTDDRLGSVTSDNATAADLVTYGATLASLDAKATISDIAANVSAHLDALELQSGSGGVVTQIALTDGGTPDIALSLQQIGNDADVLARIISTFKYAITDGSANIAADLGAGGTSHILTLGPAVDSITVSASGTLTLTAGTLLAGGVDDSGTSALTKLAGGTRVAVTGVTVGDFADFTTLAVAPNSFAVADSGGNIATDLERGSGSSALLAHRTSITGIVPTGTITLDYGTASAAHVDDGAGSVFSLMPGATLDVTGAPVAGIASLFTTGVHASSITVTDTAGDVAADLETDSPVLVQYLGQISGITVSPGGSVTLDAGHALASGVDDGAGSVFGKLSGGSLTVTGATLDEFSALLGRFVVPASVTIVDTATLIEADLLLGAGSAIETHANLIGGITFSSGSSISLTDNQAELVLAALAQLPADSLTVSGVSVADIPTIAALTALTAMTVQDSTTNIHTDLIKGANSALEQYAGMITGVGYSLGSAVSLTDAQAELVLAALAKLPASSVTVSTVSVADVQTIAGLAALTTMSVSDAVATVQTDLASVTSTLVANHSKISSITLTGGTTLTMTVAQINAASSTLALTASYVLAVNDTAINVQNDLALGASSVIVMHHTHISSSTLPSNSTITLTESQATASFVAGFLRISSNLSSFIVTGATVAQINTVVGLSVSHTTMTLSDTALDVQNDLALGGTSKILSNIASITSIVLPTASTITLSESQATHSGVGTALSEATNLSTFAVTGATVAQVTDLLALSVAGTSISISDSAADIQADLTGAGVLVAQSAIIGSVTVTGGGTITLTEAQLTAANVDDGAGSVFAKMSGLDHLAVTGVAVSQIATVSTDRSVLPDQIEVSDSADALQSDLTGASEILAKIGDISEISVSSGGPLSLTDAQASTAALALAKLDPASLTVTGVAVGNVAARAGLSALTTMTVSDTASNVHDNLILGAGSALQTHAGVISGIALTSGGPVSLTDTQAQLVLAALAEMAAGSLTVTGVTVQDAGSIFELTAVSAGSGMTVSDSAAHIGADLAAGGSHTLLTDLAKITAIAVSDGAYVTLAAADTAAVTTVLQKLGSDSLTVTGVAVADIGAVAALGALHTMTVSDDAANVQADLTSGLSQLRGHVGLITGIDLDDSGTPTIALSMGNLTTNSAELSLISTTPYHLAVSDTSGNIETDLGLGSGSFLLAHLAALYGITVSDGGAITLTASAALTAGIDDGANSVFAKMSGFSDLEVTDVAAAAIPGVLALQVPPTHITVSDSAADIANDLNLGATDSAILHNLGSIDSITAGDDLPVSITAATAHLAGVADDAVTSVMAKLAGHNFEVTGALVSDVAGFIALTPSPASISISDSAADIQADLTGAGVLVAQSAIIGSVTVTGGGTITLTEAQLTAANVDDGAGSVFAKMSGLDHLAVTGVAVSQIATVSTDRSVLPDQIEVSDSADALQSDLTGASEILAKIGDISEISVSSGGPLSLTDAQASTAALALAKLDPASLTVTGVAVGNVAARAGLSALTTMTVSDTASNVHDNLILGAGSALQTHAGVISGIALTSGGPVSLTDTQAQLVLAALAEMAAGSLTVTGVTVQDAGSIFELTAVSAGSGMTVSDSAAHIGADLAAGGSHTLLTDLAKITAIAVSDGAYVTLAAADTAAVTTVLQKLGSDSLTVTGVAVADIGAVAALGALHTMTVSDDAANVQADLTSGLSQLRGHVGLITGIDLDDSGTPTIALSMGNLTTNSAELSLISTTPYHLAVSDTSGNIETDLGLGSGSFLLAHLAALYGITVSDGGAITLTASAALTAGIDDGANSVFAKMSGFSDLEVTDVAAAAIPGVLALQVPPTHITVSDSAADIANDLNLGATDSAILHNLGSIDSITASDDLPVSITAATAHLAGVADDAVTSVMAKLAGHNFEVTGALVSDVAGFIALTPSPASISISDSAADIQADLTGAGVLVAQSAIIGSVTVTGGGTITLTEAQLTAANVDDGAGSVFAKMSGLDHLAVTGVAVSQIATVSTDRSVLPDQIEVSDSADALQSDLTGASEILAKIGDISEISVSSGGPLSLTDAQASTAALALAKLDPASLTVTGVAVGNVAARAGLSALTTMTVSDTASNVHDNLILGAGSALQTHAGVISGIALTSGGPVSLTDTQAQLVLAALAEMAAGSLTVTGVTVQDAGSIFELTAVSAGSGMTVSDSAAHIGADLAAGGSHTLLTDLAKITAIAVSDGAYVTLAAADTAAVTTVLQKLGSDSLTVTGVAVADIGAVAALGALHTMTVSDDAANVQADLMLDADSALQMHAAAISSISLTDAGPVSLTDTQAEFVLAALAKLDPGTLTVTAVSVDDVGTISGLGAVAGLTVSDTASNLRGDLIGGDTSVLQLNAAKISSISVSSGGPVSLTNTQAEAVLTALAKLNAGTLTVTGVTVSDVATIAGLTAVTGGTGMTVSDSATNIHDDLVLNTASELYQHRGKISHMTVTGGQVDIGSTEVADVQLSALALLPANTLVVTGVTVAGVAGMAALAGLDHMTVADSAANVQADLTGGGAQVLQTDHALIGGITVTDGPVTLSDSDAEAAMDALALLGGTDTLVVTDVVLADVASIAAITALGHMTVSDTAGAVHGDLVNGAASVLELHAVSIGTVSFSSGSLAALTGAQAALVMDALAKLPAASLTVSGATVAEVHALGELGSLDTMTVSDTAAHIVGDLTLGASSQLEDNASSIGSISSTTGTIELSYAAVSPVTSAIGKLSSGLLTVDNVPVANVDAIAGLGVVLAGMTVQDTGGAVQTDLNLGGSSVLEANVGMITHVSLSSGSVTLSDDVADMVTSALALLPSGSLSVTGVPIEDIAAIDALGGPLAGMTVSDTGDNVAADLISGGAIEAALANITSISLISGSVAMTYTEATAVLDALAKLASSSLTVSDVSLMDVASIALLSALSTMTVSGTGDAIGADLMLGANSVIESNIGKISGISLSSGSVSLSDAQANAVFAALAKLPDASLTVTGVPLGDVAHVAGLGSILAGMTVLGSASEVQTDLVSGTVIAAHASAIGSISLTSGQVTLTDAQADGVLAVLTKLPAHSLVVTGVPIADIAAISALSSLDHMTVADSAANIVADLTGGGVITGYIGSIASVAVNDGPIDAPDAATIFTTLGGKFDEAALTIADTASALVTAQGSEPGMLSAAQNVTLNGNASGVSAADATTLYAVLRHSLGGKTLSVADSASDLLALANAAGIAFATSTMLNATQTIDASTATQLAGLHAFNAAGPAITIQDSPANLIAAANAAGIAIATTVEPDGPYTVSAATLTTMTGITGFTANSQAITVAGNISDITGLSPTALSFTTLAHVTDTTAHVAAALDSLQSTVSAHGDAMSITLSDATSGTPTIFIDAATYAADRGAIDSIGTSGVLNVTDSAAALAAIAGELASDTVVGEVDVTDTTANILSNLTALESIGGKFLYATITDTTVNASEVSALLTIPNFQAGALTISDTGSQIAAAMAANGAPGLAFLNSHTVALSANSVIAASDAVALEQLSHLTTGSFALVVWDTASHLTDSVDGYLAAVKNGLITAVYLKTTGGTATITAATAASLLSIATFNKDNPPVALGGNGAPNTLILLDTAAHLESAFSALITHGGSLSGIQVSTSATVTDAVFADLLTLGATMSAGHTLTVRDSAATIIGNAPQQLAGGPSIAPSAWQLSGSATVAESGAAFLGALAGLSTGAYTLTLSASDATTSLADANAIGTLGNAFHRGAYHLTVNGSVSYVSGLSSNARLIVTPDITDTFSQIATLAPGDGLLGGTITVTDSEAISTTPANAFLALLGGSGIPVASVGFGGHVESIVDTLSNIQALTGSGAWTSNPGVHSDFTLVAADMVANLIDPANTTVLASLNGTTLNGNQTVLAASAEALFGVESTIHFSLGSYTITIQDTAAGLLNPDNADGEALATVWRLSGDDTVGTDGAETLLPEAQFHLNHLLTVSDTSANLLDGVLSGVITAAAAVDASYGGSIHVTLSDAETLDANTAEALVSLPGFTNTGELSIADGSAYLLNPNNLPAETDSTSVTLAGDETVSAGTAARVADLPHFAVDGNVMSLASNDYANGANLATLAGLGSGFNLNGNTLTLTQDASVNATQLPGIGDFGAGLLVNGHSVTMTENASVTAAQLAGLGDIGSGLNVNSHTLTMTEDALNLTPTEYAAVQSDNVVPNGHLLSAMAVGVTATESSGTAQFHGAGVTGATVTLYDAGGASVTTTSVAASAFTVSATDAGVNFALTETVGGVESAPVIALQDTILTGAATADGASFATSGQVHVGTNEYMNLYTAGAQPGSPANPVLVYDPHADTLSFDAAGHAAIVLVTLGTATHPASLDPSEIFVKHA